MLQYIKTSVMAKLMLQFFMVGLIPLIILGSLTYALSRSALEKQAFNHITAINHTKKARVIGFLEDRKNNLILLSRSPHLRTMLQNRTYQEMSPLLDYHMKAFGYNDIILLNQTDQTLYSASAQQEYGMDSENKPSIEPFLRRLTQKILENEEVIITDITAIEPGAPPALFVGTPVYADTGELSAVLVAQINASRITALLTDTMETGKTQDTYLVGHDLFMRSNPRLAEGEVVLKRKADSPVLKNAFKNISGTCRLVDYRGVEVLNTYSGLSLKETLGTDFDWVIITQVDTAEAFSLLHHLGINILWTGVVLILLVGVAGFVQSKMISRPINDLSYRFVMLNDGDFTASMPEPKKKRSDEIGILIKAFNSGSKKLRKQMKMLMDSTNLLVSSISQISTTASQLATSASETSTSISEVTTTVEEVRQTSEVATEKAENVAQNANDTARISEKGRQATENTMAGINRIRDEMRYIAESTVHLSEQSKRIEEIIDTVSDIADQSNILSVNAAIEAAKAGEHGKGFAVVAQEVKSLSDQSKEATNQVRAILEEIQKATSAAVMATERGSKTVDEAVSLSEQARLSIETLATRITESSDAAMQITASNQQQLSGMDQLSQAMESINDATQQNLEGVKQLEEAIKTLDAMVHTMKEITSGYKI